MRRFIGRARGRIGGIEEDARVKQQLQVGQVDSTTADGPRDFDGDEALLELVAELTEEEPALLAEMVEHARVAIAKAKARRQQQQA